MREPNQVSTTEIITSWTRWCELNGSNPRDYQNNQAWNSFINFIGGYTVDQDKVVMMTPDGRRKVDILLGPHAATILKVYEIQNAG